MDEVERRHHFPDIERLSVLTATILLALTLARLIDLPAREFATQLPGLYISFEINEQTFIALLVAGLTASGADWLIRDHPALRHKFTIEHWLLPALTAWAISLPLSQLPIGLIWVISLAGGGCLLFLVLVSEYIVVDPEDVRQPPAAAGLIAVSFALYLILATALRFANLRLFLLLPALSLAGILVSLRALHLRLHGQWALLQAGLVALITAQIAAALHYWPLTPVAYGLSLLGPAYALTIFLGNLAEGETLRQAVLEPAVVLILIWGVVFWLG